MSGSGISWAICKSAPSSRQITMPAPHHCFLQAGCPSCRPTNSVKALKAETYALNQSMKPKLGPNIGFRCWYKTEWHCHFALYASFSGCFPRRHKLASKPLILRCRLRHFSQIRTPHTLSMHSYLIFLAYPHGLNSSEYMQWYHKTPGLWDNRC